MDIAKNLLIGGNLSLVGFITSSMSLTERWIIMMKMEQRLERKIQNVYEWLGREFSYQEAGAPNAQIMVKAINELTLDFEADGKYEKSHYLCVQSPFYSGVLELTKNVSLEELREERRAEETKFSILERENIKWMVARAYCLEEEYERARTLYNKNEMSKALEILNELAKCEHYYANFQLANECISQQNYSEAVKILQKLLKRRPDKYAYIFLGNLYSHGNGVSKDLDKAYECYEKAAEMGSVEAMKGIAQMNFLGQVSHPAFLKASDWYHKAALEGDSESMYMAGICDLFRKDPEIISEMEDKESWEKGIKLLEESGDERAVPLLHYAHRSLPHRKKPKLLGLEELYKILCEDQKKGDYVYRGQTRAYAAPLRPSAYRPCHYSRFAMLGDPSCQQKNWGREFYLETNDFERLGKKRTEHAIKRIMSMHVNNALGYPLTQALFQQAGYSSEGLDVSYDIHIALFFALYEYKYGSYVRKESKEPSIIYRWKLPAEKVTLESNYYSKAHFIPTLDILNSFDVCESIEESVSSLNRYLDEIGWGKLSFEILGRRPFELIKIPRKTLTNSRIALQKGALLLPDFISGYLEQERHEEWGYKLSRKTNLEWKLVQDLSDPSICDSFLIDCSHLDNFDFDIFNLPDPKDIYDDSQEDITHILTHNIFERSFQEIMESGTPFWENNPAMPGYGISYLEALDQLRDWNQQRNKYQYFFV